MEQIANLSLHFQLVLLVLYAGIPLFPFLTASEYNTHNMYAIIEIQMKISINSDTVAAMSSSS